MNALKMWKAQNRERWRGIPFKKKMGLLSAVNGFSGAMIAVVATTRFRPQFWHGALLGAWIGMELVTTGLLIHTSRNQPS